MISNENIKMWHTNGTEKMPNDSNNLHNKQLKK